MKHRAVIIGAGRIGAGFNWHDDAYTHAGAYKALPNRVELVGFVEPNVERAAAATKKWGKAVFHRIEDALANLQPDIVSLCVQPEQQEEALGQVISRVEGVWCEKPFMSRGYAGYPIQVNYMRRGDKQHQILAADKQYSRRLIVYGKDDIHTRCHFEDLAKWFDADLIYRRFDGPCAYVLQDITQDKDYFFDDGGVNGGVCFEAMLNNLLDHVDTGIPLWSPSV